MTCANDLALALFVGDELTGDVGYARTFKVTSLESLNDLLQS